jgi:hypothetical protein
MENGTSTNTTELTFLDTKQQTPFPEFTFFDKLFLFQINLLL